MGPKLAELLLERDRGGRPVVPGIGAVLYRGYKTRKGRENTASDRCLGDRGRESNASSNRPRTLPLSYELAVYGWQLPVRGTYSCFEATRLDKTYTSNMTIWLCDLRRSRDHGPVTNRQLPTANPRSPLT